MPNKEHIELLNQGVKIWNYWREKNTDLIPNLREADLRKADLRYANLSGADLLGADLLGAKLSGADLSGANLKQANLREVNLSQADLSGANLYGANLSGASLISTKAVGTNFEQTILTGVGLEDWRINSNTIFDGVICDYVYLKAHHQERRPSSGKFAPREFTKLFAKVVINS